MAYFEEICPKRKLVRQAMGCLFALLLGLMVCLADIRFPADAENSQARLRYLLAENAAFPDYHIANTEAPDASDLSDSPFVPTREPELLPFDRIIHEAAGRHHVDADLILAVIMAESQFNPNAKSKKGAKGLMQLMPVTANALEVSNIYCPQENVDAGVRHLRWLLDRFDGDLRLALAAYNAGMQNVLRYDGVPPYPETRTYVRRVLELYAEIKDDPPGF
jgi:soluble lytic murein transglycosylase-like protein